MLELTVQFYLDNPWNDSFHQGYMKGVVSYMQELVEGSWEFHWLDSREWIWVWTNLMVKSFYHFCVSTLIFPPLALEPQSFGEKWNQYWWWWWWYSHEYLYASIKIHVVVEAWEEVQHSVDFHKVRGEGDISGRGWSPLAEVCGLWCPSDCTYCWKVMFLAFSSSTFIDAWFLYTWTSLASIILVYD